MSCLFSMPYLLNEWKTYLDTWYTKLSKLYKFNGKYKPNKL